MDSTTVTELCLGILVSLWGSCLGGTPINPAGQCIWYGNCGLDPNDQSEFKDIHILPCAYDGPPKPPSKEDIET